MNIHDLSPKELDELRDTLYWKWMDEGKIDVDTLDGITDEQLFEEYKDIHFVPDDFYCNQPDYIVEV